MKHSTFLFGLLAAILSLLSVQTAQAGDKLKISSASASISHYTGGGSSYPVSNVFDGSTSTKYWSNGPQTLSTYVQVVLAEESNIGSVKLYFCSGDQPNGGTISYSTDGSTWTNAKTFAKSEITGSNYLYSCDIDGAPLAKYVRLTLTSPNTSQWFQLSEFEVYGPSENQVSVTFHYDAGGTYQFDVEKTYVIGTTLTLAEVSDITYFKDFAFNTEDLTVSATNKEFTVNCTPDFPFTEGIACKMYGANSDGVKNANASDYCFTARTEDDYITYQGVKDAVDANSYWIFEHVAGTTNQFYVYNMGKGKYLSSSTPVKYAVMADKGKADTAVQIFRITPNEDGFNLQHQGDTNCCGTHKKGATDNPYLGTAWGASTDPSHSASRVYIKDIAPELAALGNDPETTEGYVGEGPSQVLKTAAAAAGETPTKANVVACLDAYNNPKLADYVTANKYYQIFFVSSDNTTNKALTLKNATQNYNSSDGTFSLETSNTAMAVAPVAEASLSQTDFIASLYTLTAGTTGMTVTNVNANVPWGAVNITNGLLATTGAGTEYPFAVVSGLSDNSRWNIQAGNGGYLAFNSAQYENAIVNNTTGSRAVARLKEVTSIPVTIKNTLWTSLCFPVDVVIPANLKAYKAASTQGMTINLEELAAGSRIPAGNGFLALAEAGGDYSFAIATGSEAEADLSGNQFTGATVKRAGMDGVDYFALATKKTVTGFYKVTTGTVPANKAYLLGEKLNQGAGANMLQFAFGEGTETGISNVNAENSGKAETYYDLNGRLVVYPTRGVYVTGSGRKVFVK
ncbi:MAG: discoidin domain-containing protein [Bacteroidales bacterium]